MTAKKRLLVVFIAAVAVGATAALVFIFQFFGDAVRERSDLYISARTDYPGLLDSLRPRTDHHWAFDRYAGRLELERSFKPGHYVLEPGMNVVEIARMLKLGMQTPVRVTLNYARTRAFLASRLARQLDADSAELMRATDRPAVAPGGRDRQPAALFALHAPIHMNFIGRFRPRISCAACARSTTAQPGAGEVKAIDWKKMVTDADLAVKIIDRQIEERKIDIKGAGIIVAGGYGMGSKENFRLVHELADVLGGEVGASRAAVDAGFTEHARQVGQTGVTVRPKLYIACGISGQIQHTAGMDQSSMVISINSIPMRRSTRSPTTPSRAMSMRLSPR